MPDAEGMIATTEDRVLDGNVILHQPVSGYRAAIDPILLAAAVMARPGARVLDLGAGVGTASLCLSHRRPDLKIDALELQPPLAALAERNIRENRAENVSVTCADVFSLPAAFPSQSFDVVMSNPPYWRTGDTRPSPDDIKRLATVEGPEGLAGWTRAASRLLGPDGTFVLIHSAGRLADILSAGDACGMRSVSVFPVWSKPGKSAKRVIVTLRRSLKSGLELLPGLVLHRDGGHYGAATERILRGDCPLF
ncbi:MAG: methyltransferase [Rhodospirillales bacterium]